MLGCAEGWWPVRECGLINVGGPFVLLGNLKGPQVLINRWAVQNFLTSPAARISRCPNVGRPVLDHRQLGVNVGESG